MTSGASPSAQSPALIGCALPASGEGGRASGYGLTPRARELLTFIIGYVDKRGYPPSYEEMRVALNVVSKSAVHRLVHQLVERGYVRKLYHRARSLEVLREPPPAPSFPDRPARPSLANRLPEVIHIPLYGRID